MAQPMICDICEQTEAAALVTMLGDGSTQALCGGCYARSALELAKTILPPEEIAQVIGPLFVEGGKGKGRSTKRQEPEPEAASPEPEPEPGPETAPEVAEPEAAAENG